VACLDGASPSATLLEFAAVLVLTPLLWSSGLTVRYLLAFTLRLGLNSPPQIRCSAPSRRSPRRPTRSRRHEHPTACTEEPAILRDFVGAINEIVPTGAGKPRGNAVSQQSTRHQGGHGVVAYWFPSPIAVICDIRATAG
jgi:hypothetical protein